MGSFSSSRFMRFLSVVLCVFLFITCLPYAVMTVNADESEEEFWRSLSTRYYYDQLNEGQKELWDQLDEGCMRFLLGQEQEYNIYAHVDDYEFTMQELDDVYYLFRKSNPQYFFLDSLLGGGDGAGVSVRVESKYLRGTELQDFKTLIRNAIDEYMALIPEDAMPETIERILIRELRRRVVYDRENDPAALQDIDSAADGHTVCSGYCMMYQALLHRAGVESIYVSVEGPGYMGHALIYVKLHNYWYSVDVTELADGQSGYTYYNSLENSRYQVREDFIPYVPSIIYGNFDGRREDDGGRYLEYSSRYVTLDGNTYFIINDMDNEMGFLADVVEYGGNGIAASIYYNSRTYIVRNANGYPVVAELAGNTPTPRPTSYPETDPTPTFAPGVEGFVERLYTVALGRDSDPAGQRAWVDSITSGQNTGADVARGFLYSDEFLNKSGSYDMFVMTLYRTFFGREADIGGLNAWVHTLEEGESRQNVIEGFINSTEWANLCLSYGIPSGGTASPSVEVEPNQDTIDFATRLYTTCLNRNADEAGLMAWARQLANQRETGTGAARGFFFSGEFMNQNVDNGEFVTRLYRTFMGREPDQAGYDAWVTQLNSGVSREEVFSGFAMSPEFTQICLQYGIVRGE